MEEWPVALKKELNKVSGLSLSVEVSGVRVELRYLHFYKGAGDTFPAFRAR